MFKITKTKENERKLTLQRGTGRAASANSELDGDGRLARFAHVLTDVLAANVFDDQFTIGAIGRGLVLENADNDG